MLEFLDKNWRYLAVFGALVLITILSNNFRSRDPIEEMAATGKLSDAYRSQMLGKMKGECATKIRARPDSLGPGFSPEKITQYCQCFADRMANEVTADDVIHIMTNKAAPPEFVTKATEARFYCLMLPASSPSPIPPSRFEP